MHKLLTLLLLGISLTLSAQNARTIMEKVDQKMRGKTSQAEMTIKVVRPSWSRTMKMKNWSKGDNLGMVLITAPAKEEGTAFLKRGNEVWNWVPRVERTIKLPPSMMMQSWMGTDFTNDDLVKQSSIVDDYHHKVVGDSTIRGRDCYKIVLTPKKDAAVVWGKLITWVDKQEFIQMRTESYDEMGELVNVMQGSDIKELGGRTLASTMEMIPQDKEGHKTIMIYESITFNEPIEDSFFTTRQMKSLK